MGLTGVRERRRVSGMWVGDCRGQQRCAQISMHWHDSQGTGIVLGLICRCLR